MKHKRKVLVNKRKKVVKRVNQRKAEKCGVLGKHLRAKNFADKYGVEKTEVKE
jgi:hypothetical protein